MRQADFSAADFARLFAEVTTEASPLDDLHRDWLQFAFDLGPYEAAHQEQQRCGSRCERSHCCASPRAFENGAIPNPFFNRIQFNLKKAQSRARRRIRVRRSRPEEPHQSPLPLHRRAAVVDPREQAKQLACNIGADLDHRHPDRSVRSSVPERSSTSRWKMLSSSAAARLKVEADPDWANLLRASSSTQLTGTLRFPRTNRSGSEGNTSRKVAQNVFLDVFTAGGPPAGTSDLAAYLGGDEAHFALWQAI